MDTRTIGPAVDRTDRNRGCNAAIRLNAGVANRILFRRDTLNSARGDARAGALEWQHGSARRDRWRAKRPLTWPVELYRKRAVSHREINKLRESARRCGSRAGPPVSARGNVRGRQNKVSDPFLSASETGDSVAIGLRRGKLINPMRAARFRTHRSCEARSPARMFLYCHHVSRGTPCMVVCPGASINPNPTVRG
jgi:hypothetical protein